MKYLPAGYGIQTHTCRIEYWAGERCAFQICERDYGEHNIMWARKKFSDISFGSSPSGISQAFALEERQGFSV